MRPRTLIALMTTASAALTLAMMTSTAHAQGLPVPDKAAEAPPQKKEKGWLGVALKTISEEDSKALGFDFKLVVIDSIFDGSPAHSSDLHVGDLFVKLDDVEIKSVDQLVKTVTGKNSGDKIILSMIRDKKPFTVPILLALRPDRLDMMKGNFLNKPAPDFSVQNPTTSKAITMADYKGQVIVLDFWATWCGPCRKAMPHLDGLSKKWKGKGLIVLGVTDEDQKTIKEFSAKNKVSYPFVLDTERAMHRGYMVSALPTLFVIDHEGVVREVFIGGGEKNLTALDESVARLIEARKKAAPRK